MDKKKYIGITIGPIFETMSLTSSPVALWAASYMFSLLSRSLCEVLTEYPEYNVAEEDIFRPAAWNAFGMDKEGADYRACDNFGPRYKKI